MSKQMPFEDLINLLDQLPEIDSCGARKLQQAEQKKDGYVSEFEKIPAWLAGWQGTKSPSVNETHICVLASSYSGYNFKAAQAFAALASKGMAPVNKLCAPHGIGLRVLEMAPELPHKIDENWTESECMAAIAFGMEATAAGGNLLGLGAIAPGNEANAYAIIRICLADESAFEHNPDDAAWYEAALKYIEETGETTDPLEAMRRLGGREIAASVGAIIAARSRRLPVLADGWAILAAVTLLEKLQKGSCDHVKFAAAQDAIQMDIMHVLNKRPLLYIEGPSEAACSVATAHGILKASLDFKD